jgi:putative DNA primase/helicase
MHNLITSADSDWDADFEDPNACALLIPDDKPIKTLRQSLWRFGYRPVAVYSPHANVVSPGKAPVGRAWTERARQNPPGAVSEPVAINALNTGILCDGLRALDLDIEDGDLVAELITMSFEMLGAPPIRFRDNSSRCLLLYRAAEGEPQKIKIDGTAGKVEVLGRGQQFVAHGVHTSGAELRWENGSPDTIPRDCLPPVTEAQIRAFLDAAASLIGATLPTDKHRLAISNEAKLAHTAELQTPRVSDTEYPDLTPDELSDIIDFIPSHYADGYDDWLRVGMAISNATNGGGIDLFDRFSRKSSKYNATSVRDKWFSFSQSPPRDVTVGTLIHCAKEGGWQRQPQPKSQATYRYRNPGAGPQSLQELIDSAAEALPEPVGEQETEIRRLATLSLRQYFREQVTAAKALGLGKTALDQCVKEVRRQLKDLARANRQTPNDPDDGSDGNQDDKIKLEIGSDVEIGSRVSEDLFNECGEIVFADGNFYYYSETEWAEIPEATLRQLVHRYDGARFPGGTIRLNKSRGDSIIHEMSIVQGHSTFFTESAPGMNCASGFIKFSATGTPTLIRHDPQHRCRHTLPGQWHSEASGEPPEGSLLHTFLTGIFKDDPDAAEKAKVLQEIAGATVAVYGTRLGHPKVAILLGKQADNGKSQFLDILRGLVPDSACSTVPIAKLSDDKFVVRINGKLLNTADELSSTAAIESDVFKAIITGNPVSGRDLYRSAIEFRPVAQHVFATNKLPPFLGGMDRGVKRRLLILEFNRSIPKAEKIIDIGRKIARQEADLLLAWAVAGAARLIRQGDFTPLESCEDLVRDWILGADPVKAWAEAQVMDGETPEAGAREGYARGDIYEAFKTWATNNGWQEKTLPNVKTVIERLQEDYPSMRTRSKDSRRIRGITISYKDMDADDRSAHDKMVAHLQALDYQHTVSKANAVGA